jgi:hypothetical protein
MARPLVTTIRYMPEPSNGKEQVLRRLRIGAQGIVAIQQAIDAPLEAQSQGHRRREEQSREQMRAALQDARAVQRKQMSQARESGASDAEIAEAVGMPEKGVAARSNSGRPIAHPFDSVGLTGASCLAGLPSSRPPAPKRAPNGS